MNYEAVTPDNKETAIADVKVRAVPGDLTPEIQAYLDKHNLKAPEAQMYRLRVIDEEIAKLQEQVDSLNAQIAEKKIVRGKVEEAAAIVKLKV